MYLVPFPSSEIGRKSSLCLFANLPSPTAPGVLRGDLEKHKDRKDQETSGLQDNMFLILTCSYQIPVFHLNSLRSWFPCPLTQSWSLRMTPGHPRWRVSESLPCQPATTSLSSLDLCKFLFMKRTQFFGKPTTLPQHPFFPPQQERRVVLQDSSISIKRHLFLLIYLPYNVMLVPAVQWTESAVCAHTTPPLWASLPSPPFHPSRTCYEVQEAQLTALQ